MKHILLATTALVATAGFAAAEVAVTGSAEIGIKGGSADDFETQFHHDINIDFAGSGESDAGITFGAEIGLEEAQDGVDTDDEDDYTVFLSFGGATLTMGDTDGALDKAMGEVNVAGASLADDETTHTGFNGNAGLDGIYDGQIARLDYAFEGFTGSLSAEMDDTGAGDAAWGLGVAYSAELAGLTISVGLGYQMVDVGDASGVNASTLANVVSAFAAAGDDITASDGTASILGLSLGTTFDNGLSAAINYSQAEFDEFSGDPTHMAIGLGYTMGALAIGVNYGEYEDWLLSSTPDGSGYGIAVSYDLGGGLSAHVGYGSSDDGVSGTDDVDTWSLGMAMSF